MAAGLDTDNGREPQGNFFHRKVFTKIEHCRCARSIDPLNKMLNGGAAFDHVRTDLGQRSATREPCCELEFVEQVADHFFYPIVPVYRQAISVGPADEDGVCAQRQCFEHIAAAADTAVE